MANRLLDLFPIRHYPPAQNGASAAAASREEKAVPQFTASNMANVRYLLGGLPDDTHPDVTSKTAFVASVLAYAAITYRAEKISEAPLYVAEAEDDETVPGHQIARLLDSPSPDFDGSELLYLTSGYLDTTGACLWLKQPDLADRTGRLTPFSGDQFSTEAADGLIYGRFKIETSKGPKWVDREDVVFFREPNLSSWRANHSRLDAALSWLNLGTTVRATVKKLLDNAVFPSIVVQADKDWQPSEDEWELFKAQLRQYAELERKGEPLALTGGGSATRVAFSLRDLLPDEILDRIEATVAAAFRMHPVVLGFLVGLRNSPWSQMGQARRMVYDDGIWPAWRRIEKGLTRQLLPEEDRAAGRRILFDTSGVAALQIDRLQQARIVARVRDETTRDERRQMLGLDPLGGDEGDELGGSSAQVLPGDTERSSGPAPEAKAATSAKAAYWLRFDLMAKAQESAWEASVYQQLQRDRRVVLEFFDDGVKSARAPETKDPPYGPGDEEKLRKLIEDVAERLSLEGLWDAVATPLVSSTAATAVKQLAVEIGAAFDVLQPAIAGYVQAESAFLIKSITDTTRDAVRNALEQGLKAGDSIPDIRKRLEDLGAFKRSRAELIARTETTRVTNGAQQSAAERMSAEVGTITKTWLTAGDDRVRDAHQALDGETIPVGDTFPNGLKAPGEPNCRCTLTYALED